MPSAKRALPGLAAQGFAAAAILAVLAAPLAQAQTRKQGDERPLDCADPHSQLAMNLCSGRALARADSTLGRLYRSLVTTLDGEAERLLRDAERKWVAYKEAHCRAYADPSRQGSIYPLLLNTCLKGLTEQRVRTLRAAYHDALRQP